MNIKFSMKVFGAVASAFLLSTAANAACGKITIADMNWSSASMMAHVDSAILTASSGGSISLLKIISLTHL